MIVRGRGSWYVQWRKIFSSAGETLNDIRDSVLRTRLLLASENGDERELRILLESGAKVDARSA